MNRTFDDIERTDESPAYEPEDSFRFLNRVAGAPWAKVRELGDEWGDKTQCGEDDATFHDAQDRVDQATSPLLQEIRHVPKIAD